MRISTNTLNRYLRDDLMRQQIELSELQEKLSTGKALQKPSDDPVNSARLVNLEKSLAEFEQFERNRQVADTRLSATESHLMNIENILMRINELALATKNAATSPDSYPAIKAEVEHLFSDLLAQANARDALGRFLFSGSKTDSMPFRGNSAVDYTGDQQHQSIRLNSNLSIIANLDGDTVFNNISNTGHSHTLHASPENSGTATLVLTEDTTVPAVERDQFRIEFSDSSTYDIINLTKDSVLVSGATVPSSGIIEINDMQVALSGEAATNDVFDLVPATNQDIFTTLQKFVEILDTPPINQAQKAYKNQQLDSFLNSYQEAFSHFTSLRAEVGTRLSQVDLIEAENGVLQNELQESISRIQDLNYSEAISALQQKTTNLEILQSLIGRTQELSLFNLR